MWKILSNTTTNICGPLTLRSPLTNIRQKFKLIPYRISRSFQHTPEYDIGHSLRVLFFGSNEFSVGPLRYLLSLMKSEKSYPKIAKIDVVYFYSETKRKGKKQKVYPLIHSFANENSLATIEWKDIQENTPCIANQYDFGVVASFGRLIPENVIKQFKLGILNIHPSLLPRWRGPAPIEHTILNGDNVTGVSIIDLSIGRFDHGKILLQRKVKVPDRCTAELLTETLADASGPMVVEVLADYEWFQANAEQQEGGEKFYARKIVTAMARIDWRSHSCDYIDRLHRALGKKVGIYCMWQALRVKLPDIYTPTAEEQALLSRNPMQPGSWIFWEDTQVIYIRCVDGWVAVKTLHVECKLPMNAGRFYQSYLRQTNKDESQSSLFH